MSFISNIVRFFGNSSNCSNNTGAIPNCAIFDENSKNLGTIKCSTFCANSINSGCVHSANFDPIAINCGFVCDGIFLNSSNLGTINNNALFLGSATNSGYVQNDSVFRDISKNYGSVSGKTTLCDGALQAGNVILNSGCYIDTRNFYQVTTNTNENLFVSGTGYLNNKNVYSCYNIITSSLQNSFTGNVCFVDSNRCYRINNSGKSLAFTGWTGSCYYVCGFKSNLNNSGNSSKNLFCNPSASGLTKCAINFETFDEDNGCCYSFCTFQSGSDFGTGIYSGGGRYYIRSYDHPGCVYCDGFPADGGYIYLDCNQCIGTCYFGGGSYTVLIQQQCFDACLKRWYWVTIGTCTCSVPSSSYSIYECILGFYSVENGKVKECFIVQNCTFLYNSNYYNW